MENSKTNGFTWNNVGRKGGMQTVLEMKQKWKKLSATRKTKVQNEKYFFKYEEERREMLRHLNERGTRNGKTMKLYWSILVVNP